MLKRFLLANGGNHLAGKPLTTAVRWELLEMAGKTAP